MYRFRSRWLVLKTTVHLLFTAVVALADKSREQVFRFLAKLTVTALHDIPFKNSVWAKVTLAPVQTIDAAEMELLLYIDVLVYEFEWKDWVRRVTDAATADAEHAFARYLDSSRQVELKAHPSVPVPALAASYSKVSKTRNRKPRSKVVPTVPKDKIFTGS